MTNFTILIVDDDQDDHDMFRSSIKRIEIDGFKISEIIKLVSTYNGQEGLDFLLKKAELNSTKTSLPDFIVLDLNMPKMDGYTMLQKLSLEKELNQIPVYILTTSKDAVQ